MEGRECTVCKEHKAWDKFNKGNALNRHKAYCKACQYDKHKKYKSRPEIRAKENEDQARRYKEDKSHYWKRVTINMTNGSKRRSKVKGLPHNITLKYVREIFPQDGTRCSYCQIGLKLERGEFTNTSPTLDRIIPSKGYVKGNVVVCCKSCNEFKGSIESAEEMREKLSTAIVMLKRMSESGL